MKFSSVFFLFLFLTKGVLFAQSINPVSWKFSYHKTGNGEGELHLIATLQDKWHIYSQFQEGDGPIPTSFSFEASDGYTLVEKVLEPSCEKIFSEVFASEVKMFSGEVTFRQKIKINSESKFKITGQLEYMSCNDFSCLPPKTETFSIQIDPH